MRYPITGRIQSTIPNQPTSMGAVQAINLDLETDKVPTAMDWRKP